MTATATRMIGSVEVIALTDGATEFAADLFRNTSESEIATLLDRAQASAIRTNFNAFLVRSAAGIVLIDAGARDLFGPQAGGLQAALEAVGTRAPEITRVVFTHLHPDHIAGAVDAEGAAAFPNAELVVSRREYGFWMDAGRFAGKGAPMEEWHGLACGVIGAYRDRLRLFDDVEGAAVAPGLTALPLPGHTPGHTGFRLEDGGEQLVLAADIVHAQDLQIPNPEIGVGFDVDGQEAAAARRRMLDMLARDGLLFSGGHILGPDKFVRATRDGSGYRIEA